MKKQPTGDYNNSVTEIKAGNKELLTLFSQLISKVFIHYSFISNYLCGIIIYLYGYKVVFCSQFLNY